MKTRERILDAALELFNSQGAANVTTHHIAAACGISPGNLYYYFRNKAEIIRALFDRALHENAEQAKRHPPAEYKAAVAAGIAFAQEYSWRYRFLKLELPQLLKQDATLRSRFLELHRMQLESTRSELASAVTQGTLAPLGERECNYLAELIWLVALFWPALIEVSGETPTRDSLDRGMDIVSWLVTGPLATAAPRPEAGEGK